MVAKRGKLDLGVLVLRADPSIERDLHPVSLAPQRRVVRGPWWRRGRRGPREPGMRRG
jgi:hypothetical protein